MKDKLYTKEELEREKQIERERVEEDWKQRFDTKNAVIEDLQQSTMEKNLEYENQIQKNKEHIRKGFMYEKYIKGEIKLDGNSEEGRALIKFMLEQSDEMQRVFDEDMDKLRKELEEARMQPKNMFQPIIDFFKNL